MTVGIVDTGIANIASVNAALAALGVSSRAVRSAGDLAGISSLVLPGVGSFGAGMRRLTAEGLVTPLREWCRAERPLLAICLGMQLLCEGSDEAPGVAGLGTIPGRCVRLPPTVRVPHLGWNWVASTSTARRVTPGYAAFANSYVLPDTDEGLVAGRTAHGVEFVSAVETGSLLACQFHPELSSGWGRALLQQWFDGAAKARARPGAPTPAGLARRIIPCLDVSHGRVMKGINFQQLRDVGDPAALAAAYSEHGADEIVVLDITATHESRANHARTIECVRRAITIPLTAGGGVRSVEDARLLLAAGADKVSVNSAALANPALLDALADEFGRQCIVLAIDAQREGDGWRALVRGGRTVTERDVEEWAVEGTDRGAGEVLLTSWDRDGTRSGPDVPLLRHVSGRVAVPVIASGGIGTTAHAVEAFRAGADAVLAASIFHDADHMVLQFKRELADAGLRMRL